jgi:hypothetical protein
MTTMLKSSSEKVLTDSTGKILQASGFQSVYTNADTITIRLKNGEDIYLE